MGSKKPKKRGQIKQAGVQRKRKLRKMLVFIVCACAVIMGSLLVIKNYTGNGDQNKRVLSASSVGISPFHHPSTDDFQWLIGRWLRPDGGYVIDIRQVAADGKMQVAYYNPRPINISQSRAKQHSGEINIFIELRDAGYPGATYDLVYNRQQDILVGFYFQPTAGQRFDVVFVRMP